MPAILGKLGEGFEEILLVGLAEREAVAPSLATELVKAEHLHGLETGKYEQFGNRRLPVWPMVRAVSTKAWREQPKAAPAVTNLQSWREREAADVACGRRSSGQIQSGLAGVQTLIHGHTPITASRH